MSLDWYWRRLRRMSAGEIAWRTRDQARRWVWRLHQVQLRDGALGTAPETRPSFPVRLPCDAATRAPDAARRALLDAADGLLDGHWKVLGRTRYDLGIPDWFLDPVTGRRASSDRCAFAIDPRSENEVGNVKQLWELSRHHHLTVLAAAWFISREDCYAIAVDRQLRSWWRQNPFLSGVHWTSGIELGLRLIAWTWIRRLLDGWPGATELFEQNPLASRQLHWHQRYLAAFRSVGSSANNHVVAEAAGQFVASCAFPWFAESERWRHEGAALLEHELASNTLPSGINGELASDYQRFVTELGLVAAVEGDAAGHPLSGATWSLLCRTLDSNAAIVDERLRGARQGDGDGGRPLLIDAPQDNAWPSLLALGAELVGPQPWWPAAVPPDVRSGVLAALLGSTKELAGRPARRPSHFADAGLTVLRTTAEDAAEIWCRCDGGPHGFGSIAAHAHADALSVEVRHRGVDVLADPGTYCYHGEPEWRAYFRSTLAHNTLCLDDQDQSTSGGPFLWIDHASSRVLEVVDDDGRTVTWSAEHEGYRRLASPALHRRTVRLDRRDRRITIVDRVEGAGRHWCRLAFHLGPSVRARLTGCLALLEWSVPGQAAVSAMLHLPDRLRWTAHEGETGPILGWYSPAFGTRQPAVTLMGSGSCGPGDPDLVTALEFES